MFAFTKTHWLVFFRYAHFGVQILKDCFWKNPFWKKIHLKNKKQEIVKSVVALTEHNYVMAVLWIRLDAGAGVGKQRVDLASIWIYKNIVLNSIYTWNSYVLINEPCLHSLAWWLKPVMWTFGMLRQKDIVTCWRPPWASQLGSVSKTTKIKI